MLGEKTQSWCDVTPELLMQFLKTGQEIHTRVTEGFPKDTRVVGIDFRPHHETVMEGFSWVRLYVKNDEVDLKPGNTLVSMEALPCRLKT